MSGPDEKPRRPEDDTEGHRYPEAYAADGEAAEGEDDVMAHVQPPPNWPHIDR